MVIPEEAEDPNAQQPYEMSAVSDQESFKGEDSLWKGSKRCDTEDHYVMTLQDEQLMSRQETLLKEIIKGGGPPRGKQISPRNSDVELVNQKIDNAKRKMSRYFAARNNM